ncbi:MAG: Na+/H+ antiporter NhaA [Bacteroidetes bacterium]|nr:MAG: Na+/H+ antiporter NhaA [Bacteroidota bacterium]
MKKEKLKTDSKFNILSFIKEESLGGYILIAITIIALVWANSGFYDSYHYLWHELQMGFKFGDFEHSSSLHHWINDGLMALFFFTIGLEIKREVLAGELSSFKKAGLPIAAAVGGMIIPALIYVIISINHPQFINGWGIPMATDIAFALGLMAMLGKRVPVSLKIFLTALAIADDLGAIMVIAVFYTESIDMMELLNAAFFLGVLIAANRMGVRSAIFYALVGGLGVWTSFLFSGVHATIAGVLIALTIPVRPKISEKAFIQRLSSCLDVFKKTDPNDKSLLTSAQSKVISKIGHHVSDANTPLQKLEHAMHPVSIFVILPIFALSNAGVHIEGNLMAMILHPISLGIMGGLILGKFLGISVFSWIFVKLKLANLPPGVSWAHIYGMSFLAGIGFTMSMFIADLGFEQQEYVKIAKVGILAASLLAGIIGVSILSMAKKVE